MGSFDWLTISLSIMFVNELLTGVSVSIAIAIYILYNTGSVIGPRLQ